MCPKVVGVIAKNVALTKVSIPALPEGQPMVAPLALAALSAYILMILLVRVRVVVVRTIVELTQQAHELANVFQ